MSGDRGFLRQLVAATVGKAMNDAPIPKIRPGTCTSSSAPAGTCRVLMDSSLVTGESAIPAQPIIGVPVVGDRVMVMFAPPHGAHVVGYVSGGLPQGLGTQVHRTSNQSMPNGWTAVNFATGLAVQDWNTASLHDLAVNPTRFTVVSPHLAGWWECHAFIQFASNATDVRGGRWLVNGATSYDIVLLPVHDAGPWRYSGSTHLQLDPDDYVELQAYHNIDGGGNLNLTVCYATLHYKGPLP